jgi:hypothetical protein
LKLINLSFGGDLEAIIGEKVNLFVLDRRLEVSERGNSQRDAVEIEVEVEVEDSQANPTTFFCSAFRNVSSGKDEEVAAEQGGEVSSDTLRLLENLEVERTAKDCWWILLEKSREIQKIY